MEIDAWDHKDKHYSGQGKDLIAALKDARKQAMIENGIDIWSAWLSRYPFPWPIRRHRYCVKDAPIVVHGKSEWRFIDGQPSDERRNL